MKKSLKLMILFSLLILATVVNSQTITPIYNIQFDPGNPGGPSPLAGSAVTVQGVVTVSRSDFSGSYFFFQDRPGPWNGIEVYISNSAYKDSTISEGDSLQITGIVGEYQEMTQIGTVTELVRLGTRKWMEPVTITTGALDLEDQYECVFVRLENVAVVDSTTNPGSGDYAWEVDDGSGKGEIGTRAQKNYFYAQADGDQIDFICGVVMERYKAYVLEPRAAYDFGAVNGITMIQSIQQVRYVEDIAGIDTSYFEDDTVLVRGIVTVPSGLFYAGAGVVVYMQDAKGGSWSGVLAFAETPTGIDILYEGDEVQVKALVTEYLHPETGVSMTELRGLEAFELLSEYNPIPDTWLIRAIDLDSTNNLDKLAEKYEGVLVQIQNAVVDSTVRWSAGIRDYRLDDGSGGKAWAESRSDSLFGYEPPVGTYFKSVTGVVYNRFGIYSILPRYTSDLVLFTGPPIFSSVEYAPVVPTTEDTIRLTASVQDDRQIAVVTLHYQINGGSFQELAMNYESGFIYAAEIGPFPDQSVITFYVSATDDEGNVSTSPQDAPTTTYSFKVEKPSLELQTIADIKVDANNDFVPDLKSTYVRVQGVVTGNRFADYYVNAYIQDETAGINLFVNGQFFKKMQVGDSVDVVGLVNHYNGLTEIQPDDTTKITILGKGTLPEPRIVTCAELGNDVGEALEGLLVVVKNVTISSGTWPREASDANIIITDATGSITLRIDKDTDIDGKAQPTGTIDIIGLVSQYDASAPYSGGYQLLPRSFADIRTATSVNDEDPVLPLVFSIAQNYPNPFNPTTNIRYSIAEDCRVRLEIYNIMGQKIKTLVDWEQTAGYKTVYWDGTDAFESPVSSGVYIYRIQAANFIGMRKMILIR